MIEAAKVGNIRTLEWLADPDPDVMWLPHMTNAAASTAQTAMLQWLYSHLKHAGSSTNVMAMVERGGHLDSIKWLHANYTQSAEALARMYSCDQERPHGGCQVGLCCFERTSLEIVQWLHENRSKGCTVDVMNDAATNGHLKIVKWLHENHTEGCDSLAMDYAASSGHLDVVKWLHENRSEGCTSAAIQFAAFSDHSEVMFFLHANRGEGCAQNAMASGDD